ncbi:MAG: hypothetical protein IPL05_06770 [Betaproteobacteria bacterium]|nr:hypothetical protein [Betaproteobacteria bacterium]
MLIRQSLGHKLHSQQPRPRHGPGAEPEVPCGAVVGEVVGGDAGAARWLGVVAARG